MCRPSRRSLLAELRHISREAQRRRPEASDPHYHLGVLALVDNLTGTGLAGARPGLDTLLLDLITVRKALPEPEPDALHPFGLHIDTLIGAVLDSAGETRAADYRASLDGEWTDPFFARGKLRQAL